MSNKKEKITHTFECWLSGVLRGIAENSDPEVKPMFIGAANDEKVVRSLVGILFDTLESFGTEPAEDLLFTRSRWMIHLVDAIIGFCMRFDESGKAYVEGKSRRLTA